MALNLMQPISFMEDFDMRDRKPLYLVLIEWIVFTVIAVAVISRLNALFLPKDTYNSNPWPTTNTYNGFYKMKRDTVDVIFVGSSVAVNAWCPQEIYNDYGIRSYNLGSEQQSIFLSYYWIKEALRFQHPKAIVLDLRFLVTMHPDNPLNTDEGLIRKCIDPMKMSHVKREAIADIGRQYRTFAGKGICDDPPAISEMSFYLTNIRFHTRWASGLSDNDFDRRSYSTAELKGWNTMIYYNDAKITPYVYRETDDYYKVDKLQSEYLHKIGDLCRENGIQLILVNLPGNGILGLGMTDGVENTCRAIASEIGADYYNFGEKTWYDCLDIERPRDYPFGHSNYWGSVKLSRFTGRLLSEIYGIQPVKDEQYEQTRDYYAMIDKDANLQYIEDFDSYLDAIHDPNYTLFFSIEDEGTGSLTEKEVNKLRTLGIHTNLKGKYRYSWYAVVDPITGVSEDISEDKKIELNGTFGKLRKAFYIASAGFTTNAPMSSIVVDGQEYSHNTRGINIVVYDNVGRSVIDSVTFDTCGDQSASRSWFIDMIKNGVTVEYNSRW